MTQALVFKSLAGAADKEEQRQAIITDVTLWGCPRALWPVLGWGSGGQGLASRLLLLASVAFLS